VVIKPNLYLAFSTRPEAVSAPDYDRWYEEHAEEHIESPGLLPARRYQLAQVYGSAAPYEHLAVYECEGEMAQWRASLNERIAAGDIALPNWFKQVQFGSWDFQPLGGLLQPARAVR
jgi:hypothetical protein